MKKLLHLAAICAIHTATEIKAYYQRRLGGGKSRRTVINIVRNKHLARVFAVAKRGTRLSTLIHICLHFFVFLFAYELRMLFKPDFILKLRSTPIFTLIAKPYTSIFFGVIWIVNQAFAIFASFIAEREDLDADFQAFPSQKIGGPKIFCHHFCHQQPALMLLIWRCCYKNR